jgi:hypothetical protein
MALWAATSSAQQLEKDRGRTGPPIRPEREIRNLPATLPALPRIQAIAITVRDRIEHQQRLASAESAPLGRGEERRTDTSPPRSSMHQHFRDVPAMRLIFRLMQNDLNRADDRSRCVFRGQHHSLAARRTRGNAVPERLRFGAGHWEHEADGRATFHTVNQHVAQLLNLAITEGLQTSDIYGVVFRMIKIAAGAASRGAICAGRFGARAARPLPAPPIRFCATSWRNRESVP